MGPRTGVLVLVTFACSLQVTCSGVVSGEKDADSGTDGASASGGVGGAAGAGGIASSGGDANFGDEPSTTVDASLDALPEMVDGDASDVPDVCDWPSGSCGDPECAPLDCAQANNWVAPPTVLQTGVELKLTVTWCGVCFNYMCYKAGTIDTLSVEPLAGWATVVGTPPSCSFSAVLQPASGATQGDVRLKALIHGFDKCHAPLTCPIDVVYQLWQGDAGTWMIAKTEQGKDAGTGD